MSHCLYSCSTDCTALQIFLVGPLLELQPDKPALKVVTATHSRFKGDFAFATAALGTDPADMILDFFGLKKVSEIQVTEQFSELQTAFAQPQYDCQSPADVVRQRERLC